MQLVQGFRLRSEARNECKVSAAHSSEQRPRPTFQIGARINSYLIRASFILTGYCRSHGTDPAGTIHCAGWPVTAAITSKSRS